MRHTKQIPGVAKKLRKLPAVANKLPIATKKRARAVGHTPEQAVQTVQDELVRLLESGYSVAEVGKVLRSAGIEVSAVTLRGYVRNAAATKRAVGADSQRTAVKKKPTTQKSTARSASSESAAAAAGNAPVARKKPALSPAPATAKARTPAPKQPVTPSSIFHDHGNLHLAKATFVVRPDTPDSDL